MNKDPVAIAWWFQLAAMPNFGCQSEPQDSSLEEVWLGHDESMDEPDQFLLQSQNGFDWQ